MKTITKNTVISLARVFISLTITAVDLSFGVIVTSGKSFETRASIIIGIIFFNILGLLLIKLISKYEYSGKER